jgi:hypothetical protein
MDLKIQSTHHQQAEHLQGNSFSAKVAFACKTWSYWFKSFSFFIETGCRYAR